MRKKWCPLRDALIWLSRATGIGYQVPSIHGDGAINLTQKANEVALQVDLLERELRRVPLERRLRPRSNNNN